MRTQLETDYLVVGSGAVGMAFADLLITESDADVVIVDRFAKPGGHWNVAYPFVRLHQPSQFYGVSSVELSNGLIDEVGWNRGLSDLATGAEVSAYFDHVMRHHLLPSGRVRYFPLCEYTGEGSFFHKLTGQEFQVRSIKTVDCTYLNTSVPSTHTPNFEVADGVRFMPLNDLTTLDRAPERYAIVGGGKTGIDAVLWLLEQGTDPAKITWIKSRDGWLLNRKNTQPKAEFFEHSIGAQASQFEAIAAAESVDDMFRRLEEFGYFLRLDPDVWPTMFHGATISELELEQLRRLDDIVRLGHVIRIDRDHVTLERGTLPSTPDTLYVDCSATAITNLEIKPIFDGELITPQTVRSYQPVFSAAFIAHVELTRHNEEEKNRLCGVVPLPNSNLDYMRLTLAFMTNQYNWNQDPELRSWLLHNRLDGFSKMVNDVSKDDVDKRAILKRLRDSAVPAAMRLTELIAEAEAELTTTPP
ncbi:MAG: NAD(P)/FAD-dependent oxidoreductase [Acidimicrobiales bacterium]|nr:NAD(P)/FAD-dependent oxidoreductase [Acidimicrobiales bacterium]